MEWRYICRLHALIGLRLAPKIFNAVVDVLHWHLQRSRIPLTHHYLDDYIIITPPNKMRCREFIAILHLECSHLGVRPFVPVTYDPPSTCRAPLTSLIRLNKGFWSDLAWWRAFIQGWTGISFLHPPAHLPQFHLYSNASESWVVEQYGVICGSSSCGMPLTTTCRLPKKSWFLSYWQSQSGVLDGKTIRLSVIATIKLSESSPPFQYSSVSRWALFVSEC